MRRQRVTLVCAGLALAMACPGAAFGQVHEGPLYPNTASGSEDWRHPRVVTGTGDRRAIYNTREPRIAVHLPERDRATGAAVLMLPGGGLRNLGMGTGLDREVAAFLAKGVAVAVLEYRTLQIDPATLERQQAAVPPPGPIRFPKMTIRNGNANPSPDDPALAKVLALATEDARAALRLLHKRAADWGLDQDRIGAIGTSAGGGVAFGALLATGSAEARPDFIISIFGPALQDVVVPADAPPLFLVTESDHGPVTDGLLALFSMWKEAERKAELHVFEVPNFSMTVDLWGPRLFAWMGERELIPTATAPRAR